MFRNEKRSPQKTRNELDIQKYRTQKLKQAKKVFVLPKAREVVALEKGLDAIKKEISREFPPF
jgi:predicted  nucleic acid-binding Zn-ribbon protein